MTRFNKIKRKIIKYYYHLNFRKMIKKYMGEKLNEEWNKILATNDFIPIDEL